MVRIGVIGCGNIMRNAHIGPTLGAHPEVELTAYYDVDEAASSAFAEEFGGEAVDSETEVCERCDAVYIAVPPNAHGAAERACLQTSTPFFVEKPLALDLEFAREVAAEVKAQGLLTMAGYQWRYTPAGQAFREALEGRTPALVNMWWYQGTPRIPFNRYRSKSGGQVVEQVTHIVDTVRYAVGEIEQVFGWARNVVHTDEDDWDNDDVGAATVLFESGAVGTITNCYALTGDAPGGNGAEVLAPDRRVLWQGKRVTIRTEDGEEQIGPFEGRPHQFEDLAFIDAVSTGDPSGILSPYTDSVKTLAVTLACAGSGESGAPVTIPG
ncbi:MAG: Gfo/Idh/MocA family oxidoreductase [Gemmatimonadota bacterium]|nr:Gfo/Idh/MocA family oxidoreductase [Gemmatimonadota bacterium]